MSEPEASSSTGDPETGVDLSIVICLYFEEDCVEECIRRLHEELDGHDLTYEVVFVDDGSRDRTVEIVERIARLDPRLKLIVLSRNHGKPAAVTAGIAHASGRAVLLMDPDLQDPPDRIVDFYRTLGEGYDLVLGVREGRRDRLSTRLGSKAFWGLLGWMTGLEIPPNLAVMRIFSRRFARELLRYGERVRFIEGIFMVIGLPRTTLSIEHRERFAGSSKFTLAKKVRLAVDAILAFSDRPIQLTVACGLVLLAFSGLYGVYLFARTLFFGIGLLGWTSTILVVLFLGSVQILLLGIIGNYVGRIYTEAKARPIYTVDRRIHYPSGPAEQEP